MCNKNNEIVDKTIEIIKFVSESNISELELETKDFNISLKKHNDVPQQNFIPQINTKQIINNPIYKAPQKEEKPVKTIKSNKSIKAPMTGTFYSAPSPDAPAFVKVGDNIKSGQTICIIEAMKMLNEIKSDKSGTIIAIKGKNGELVEKGAEIIILE